jgi:Mce-associated membrane protein
VTESSDGPARSGLVLPIALVVLAGLLVGLGVWFQGQAGNVRYNRALVDSAGTTEVAGQVREAVEKAFSYNFADISATEKAAGELLVGKAKCQYDAIFAPVRTLAPEQKLVVTVKAVSSGVTSLDDDRATVLLFVDQVTTRTTDNQSGGGIATMRVGAQKVDGRWKVDNMEMFGRTGDQAAEIAKC